MNSATNELNVSGIEFIAAALTAAAVFFHLPATVLRQSLWAAANLLVLWIVLPNPASWIALAIFLGAATQWHRRSAHGLVPAADEAIGSYWWRRLLCSGNIRCSIGSCRGPCGRS